MTSGEINLQVGTFWLKTSAGLLSPNKKDNGKIIKRSHVKNYLSYG